MNDFTDGDGEQVDFMKCSHPQPEQVQSPSWFMMDKGARSPGKTYPPSEIFRFTTGRMQPMIRPNFAMPPGPSIPAGARPRPFLGAYTF
ncbi:hypothetical protein [Azospirillum palustre]|uniref:hypothetical protein n=1 Tax=Azospirillum palustre TaxID=2044885 RepID=UPI0011777876|nr:hypothetical protein [Azospirillum palustre]